MHVVDKCLTAVCAKCRHWKEVMRITGKELNLAEDVFKLQHLLDCHLLKVRDDMEDLTTSAVKEEQIEVKLATVSADWAEINLVFADYKTRGTVILKVSNQLRCMSAFCLPSKTKVSGEIPLALPQLARCSMHLIR